LDPDNRNCLFGVLRLDTSVVVNERIRYSLLFFVFWQIKFTYSAACSCRYAGWYVQFFSSKNMLQDYGNPGVVNSCSGRRRSRLIIRSFKFYVTKSSSKPKTFPCPVRRQRHLPRTKTHCLSGLLTDLIFVTTVVLRLVYLLRRRLLIRMAPK
jgi:hypothetical protein